MQTAARGVGGVKEWTFLLMQSPPRPEGTGANEPAVGAEQGELVGRVSLREVQGFSCHQRGGCCWGRRELASRDRAVPQKPFWRVCWFGPTFRRKKAMLADSVRRSNCSTQPRRFRFYKVGSFLAPKMLT